MFIEANRYRVSNGVPAVPWVIENIPANPVANTRKTCSKNFGRVCVMSEPIREQLAKVIASQTREFHREPNFGHSASGSANECSECERQRGVFLAFLSPVGETEAAKLPLDPELVPGATPFDKCICAVCGPTELAGKNQQLVIMNRALEAENTELREKVSRLETAHADDEAQLEGFYAGQEAREADID